MSAAVPRMGIVILVHYDDSTGEQVAGKVKGSQQRA
jgi:hypothetical protein